LPELIHDYEATSTLPELIHDYEATSTLPELIHDYEEGHTIEPDWIVTRLDADAEQEEQTALAQHRQQHARRRHRRHHATPPLASRRHHHVSPMLERWYEETNGRVGQRLGTLVAVEGQLEEMNDGDMDGWMHEMDNERSRRNSPSFTEDSSSPPLSEGGFSFCTSGKEGDEDEGDEDEGDEDEGNKQDDGEDEMGEDEMSEDGWVDTRKGDNYVEKYGDVFADFKGPRTAALFTCLEAIRMLVIGLCLSLLVGEPDALTQGTAIFGVHALQFGLQILIWPEPSLFDTFLNSLAMSCDLMPLLVAILPTLGVSTSGKQRSLIMLH
jgi:hypothetical protein